MNRKNRILFKSAAILRAFEGKKSHFLLRYEYVLVSFLLYESKLFFFFWLWTK